MTSRAAPDWPSVLEVRVEDLALNPILLALCAGYERGSWRAEALVDDLMNWLPEFALNDEELRSLDPTNLIRLVRRAMFIIYQTKKFQKRGELGELLLHAVLRRHRSTIPAVSKIYYKDSANDTVKGFDAVHVVQTGATLELWLGEVKLYSNISKAIRDVIAELKAHSGTDFLRGEFIAITNKIDPHWPHAESLKRLLDPNVSLDEIFSRACIPVLLTYDSPNLAAHQEASDAFKAAFDQEVRVHHTTFAGKTLPVNVRVELFLVPLHDKKRLVDVFDGKLKAWQTL